MQYEIFTFYRFQDMAAVGSLSGLRDRLRQLMVDKGIVGTIILADEGINSTICGTSPAVESFVSAASEVIAWPIVGKSSFSASQPFRKVDVKIKPEIVTLKRTVDMTFGEGTHIKPSEWHRILDDPDVLLLDTRNDYEFRTGTFAGALNPETEKFSDLPDFVNRELDPEKHRKVAMFCTGGIRCEKFAPFMKGLGFQEVYQLEGGILKYLEEVPASEQRWDGECYVFDRRVTVKDDLAPGDLDDLSQTS